MQRLLVVGLGNPGPAYSATRHNAGFWVVEELAQRYSRALRKPLFRRFREARVRTESGLLGLAQPLTFMNRCGDVIPTLLQRSQTDAQHMVVVCDTLDLPPGTLRMKRKGSDAGHRGIASIISVLGHGNFPRLYIGIGRPTEKSAVPQWVLSEPEPAEERSYREAVPIAADACVSLLSKPIETVMNELHRRN